MQNMRHIMLDLETFSTRSDAAIVSIGAVLFDPNQGRVSGETFYRVIDLSASTPEKAGHIDPATVLWWMRQDKAAQDALTKEPGLPLGEALQDFGNWLRTMGMDASNKSEWRLWANDPDFDVVILANAYQRYALPLPFSYRSSRSMRTLCELAREFDIDPRTEPNPQKHNALQDAIYQARVVTSIKQELRRRMHLGDKALADA